MVSNDKVGNAQGNALVDAYQLLKCTDIPILGPLYQISLCWLLYIQWAALHGLALISITPPACVPFHLVLVNPGTGGGRPV